MERKTLTILLLAVLIQVVGIFDHSLWTTDEPWVAEISREMVVSDDYVIPKLSNTPFLEKPPLYYAVTAVFWRIFGTGNEGIGRLASVLFATGTLLVIFFGARVLYGERAAALATLILATTSDFFLTSHWMKIDNALAFFITSAFFSFILAYRQSLKMGYILFWVSLALAFMTKGIIGIAIPGVGVAVFILWKRDFSVIRKAWVFPGILVVAFTMIAWAWALYLHGGNEFVSKFFLYNNLGRFLHIKGLYNGMNFRPFSFYLPAVVIDSLPWSILMISALIAVRKPDDRMKFLCSWFFGGFLLLSFAATKRHLYLLPIYPAMAVIVGYWMSRINSERSAGWEKVVLRGGIVILVLAALVIPAGYVKIDGSIPVAIVGFLVFTGMFLLGSRMIADSLPERLLLGLALVFLTWTPLVFPQLDTMKTYKPFFQEAGRIIGQDKVIGYRINENTLSFSPFYGGFYIKMALDKKTFQQMIIGKEAPYAVVLPSGSDVDLIKFLECHGKKLLEIGDDERTETQLWRLSHQTGGDAQGEKCGASTK